MFLPWIIYNDGYFFFYGDYNVQQIPFYQMIHDSTVSGNIGWSYTTDLGANIIGSYSFYMAGSPFFYLTLLFPSEEWSYTGQTGTLTSIEAGYDYATATVTISEIIGNQVTATAASFANQQSVYRFGFKDGETYIDPKSFSISASGGKIVQSMSYSGGWTPAFGDITVTPASAAGDHFYYVSLQNQSTANDTYSFVITGSDDALYLASKAIPASVLDVPGKFISAKSVSATKPSFAPAPSGAIEAPENVL